MNRPSRWLAAAGLRSSTRACKSCWAKETGKKLYCFFFGTLSNCHPVRLRIAAAHTIHRELRSINQYIFDFRRFCTFRIPTLILLGGESPPRRHLVAETLHRSLPDSQFAILQGQQHSAMRTAPDLFVHEVVKFLNIHGSDALDGTDRL